jgi:hypothetical protein
MAHVLGWSDLTDLLAKGIGSIFPNADEILSSSTSAPFLALLQEDTANTDNVVDTISFAFWVYDTPEQSYWRIGRILQVIRKRMEGLELGATADGILDPFQYEFTSGEARDDELDKLFKYARYRSWLVA